MSLYKEYDEIIEDIRLGDDLDNVILENMYSSLDNSLLTEDTSDDDSFIENNAKLYDLFNEMSTDNRNSKKDSIKKMKNSSINILKAIKDGFHDALKLSMKSNNPSIYIKDVESVYVTKGTIKQIVKLKNAYAYVKSTYKKAIQLANDRNGFEIGEIINNAPYIKDNETSGKYESVNKDFLDSIVDDCIDIVENYAKIIDEIYSKCDTMDSYYSIKPYIDMVMEYNNLTVKIDPKYKISHKK